MPSRFSLGKTFHALERAIDIAQQRHTLIAGNISNMETPGYRAKEIDFETVLGKALESNRDVNLVKTNPRHIGSTVNLAQGVESFEEEGEWNGYNWVNIDKEITKLIENNLRYKTAAERAII